MGNTGERAEKNNKGKRSKKKKAIFRLAVFMVIVFLTLVCSIVSYKYAIGSIMNDDKEVAVSIEPGKEIKVDIPRGSGTSSIAGILKEKGIIAYPKLFKLVSKINGFDGTYQFGTHILSKDLKYTEIMRVLSSKPLKAPSTRITVPEGYTYKKLVELLSEKKLINKEQFNKIAQTENFEYEFLENIPEKRANRLEGYLFPETYEFDIKGGEKEIINKMLGQFDKIFTKEHYEKAKKLGMKVDEIITLASIIEREAKVPEERNRIAGVFYNRLNNKNASLRKLQSCATIQYIFYYNKGIVKDTILNEDTQIDDPYNTYIHEGLPPGPICSPGEDSIDAALNPEKHNYLYFVAKEDGTGGHYFSQTYKEHLSAQAKAKKNSKK